MKNMIEILNLRGDGLNLENLRGGRPWPRGGRPWGRKSRGGTALGGDGLGRGGGDCNTVQGIPLIH